MSDNLKKNLSTEVNGSPKSLDVEIGPTDEINISHRDLELERAVNNYVPDTDAEKRFVRKLDLIMMPTLWFMYILAYIDRQNIVSVMFPYPSELVLTMSTREMQKLLEWTWI